VRGNASYRTPASDCLRSLPPAIAWNDRARVALMSRWSVSSNREKCRGAKIENYMKFAETENDPPGEQEGLQEVMTRLGDRWTVTVLSALGRKRLRFNALHRDIKGISQRMLTVSLRSLERDGLVVRTVFATVPLRVEYELSRRGISLVEVLHPVNAWVTAHWHSIVESRRSFDRQGEQAE